MTRPGVAASGLLATGEVAAVFGVHARTVCYWARIGLIPSILTPGGRRRYKATDVEAMLRDARTAQRQVTS